ncbi:MAG: hypothetical protein ACI9Y7_002271 [Dokdonia sp.]|jgi:hypothetical protein
MGKVLLIFMSCIILSCTSANQEVVNMTTNGITEETNESTSDTLIITRVASEEGRSKAFTDIIFFDNQFFLVFRDSDKHALGEDGAIHIFNSIDGSEWTFMKEIRVQGIDLRDPSFTIQGEQLSLYIHGSKYENQEIVAFSDYNLKYSETNGWLELTDVLLDNLTVSTNTISGNEAWPWRVNWHNDKAYSVGYNATDIFDVYESDDGLFFTKQNVFENISALPTEARIRIDDNGEFFVLVRRITGSTLLGRTFYPSEGWEWFGEIPIDNLRGPNFLLVDDHKMLFAGGLFGFVYLGLYDIETNTYRQIIDIPSSGDGSYPGMMIQDNILWMSYYTSYENTEGSSIYVAKINLDSLSI